ncbi:MAG: NAD(+)/NADH kinase [Chthoniobacteraceae bacterium]
MSARTIGLIANTAKPGAAGIVHGVVSLLRERGIEPMFDTQTAALLGERSGHDRADLARRCELLLILGGDGTLLEAVREMSDPAPAVFGINLGSLGFLTSVGSAAWREAVDCIATDRFRIEERTLLSIELVAPGEVRHAGFALNDAVISRGELSRLIKLDVSIDGAWLSEYNADGLIIATPTGSTAYALSAGGPVLTPDSGVFIIAPICPHVLTMRPVIVSDHSVIEITPKADGPGIFLTIDGQHATSVSPGEVLRITKAAHKLRLATLPETTFFEVLRQKLKWSGTAV